MPVVTTAEYVVMAPDLRQGPAFFRPDPDTILPLLHVQIWPLRSGDSCPDPASHPEGSWLA
jgi:hypothetical protein